MTSLLKPHVVKRRLQWGQRFVASIGTVQSRDYETPAGAREGVERDVLDALNRFHKGTVIFEQHGLLAIVTPDLAGWSIDIVDPAEVARDGFKRSGTWVVNGDRAGAIIDVRRAITQRTWSLECEDDFAHVLQVNDAGAAFWREALSYIAWQRDYKRRVDGGALPVHAHRDAQADWGLLRGGGADTLKALEVPDKAVRS